LEDRKLNRTNARAYHTIDGWIGEFKMVHWACYRTVMEKDPKTHQQAPKLFANAHEAECAAWRVLRDMDEPEVLATGKLCSMRQVRILTAQKHFKEGASA
jgi:hypothetical protein